MQELHLVGFTTDRRHLIFSSRQGAKSGSFLVPVDEALQHAVETLAGELADRADGDDEFDEEVVTPAADTRVDSKLSVREVQARLRAGVAVEEIAVGAEVDPAWVERFAPPIRAEQQQVVTLALATRMERPRSGLSSVPLGDAVLRAMAERDLGFTAEAFREKWSARLVGADLWSVEFTFVNRGRERTVSWTFEPAERRLTTSDRFASQLGFVADDRAGTGRGSSGDDEAADDTGPEVSGATAGQTKPRAASRTSKPKNAPKQAAAKKGAAKKGAAKKSASKKSAAKKAPAKKASATARREAAVAKKVAAARKAATKKLEQATAKRVAAAKKAAKRKADADAKAAARAAEKQRAAEERSAARAAREADKQRLADEQAAATAAKAAEEQRLADEQAQAESDEHDRAAARAVATAERKLAEERVAAAREAVEREAAERAERAEAERVEAARVEAARVEAARVEAQGAAATDAPVERRPDQAVVRLRSSRPAAPAEDPAARVAARRARAAERNVSTAQFRSGSAVPASSAARANGAGPAPVRRDPDAVAESARDAESPRDAGPARGNARPGPDGRRPRSRQLRAR